MLMGKGYSLLASSSGSVPGGCTMASWTARLSSSDDTDADAEHEEMVNELQAVVLIGSEWANTHDPTQDDDPLSPIRDSETAASERIEDEDGGDRNQITAADDGEDGSDGLVLESVEIFEDDVRSLYPTVVELPSVVESPTPTSVVEHTLDFHDEPFPFPVYEEIGQQYDPPPSTSNDPDHQLTVAADVEVLDYVEELTEVPMQQPTFGAEYFDGRAEEQGNNEEVEVLDQLANERRREDYENSDPQREELTATPRRSSQLSETLRNNLERLLQRGPPFQTSVTSSGRRRRRTRRDDGLTASGRRRPTAAASDHKHHHHRHHHRHHNHHHQQQHQEQEDELYDVQSLATDNSTVRSLSATSLSSISDGTVAPRTLIYNYSLCLGHAGSPFESNTSTQLLLWLNGAS